MVLNISSELRFQNAKTLRLIFKWRRKFLKVYNKLFPPKKAKDTFFLTRSKTNFFNDYFSDRCIDFFFQEETDRFFEQTKNLNNICF